MHRAVPSAPRDAAAGGSRIAMTLLPLVARASVARGAGLAPLVVLASLLLAPRLQGSPAVRTVAVGRAPVAVVVDARTRRVFVANRGSSTVSVLDAESGAVLANVAVVPHPSALAVATTAGRVFAVSDHVTRDDAGRVSVLDATSGRLLRTVAVGRGKHLLAVHERTGHVFVTNGGDASVSLLDSRSGWVLRTIPIPLVPAAMAMDARTGRVLLTGVALDQPSLTGLSLLDARSGTVLRTVPVGTLAGTMAVDERTGQALVSNALDGTVLVLDGRTASVVRTLAMPWAPGALAVDPRRGRVVVLTREEFVPAAPAGQVQVLDGRMGRLLKTVAVGAEASALAVDERTGKVFTTAINVYGRPAGSDSIHQLRAWLRRWLPRVWVLRLLPLAPVTTMGTVTMLDLSRL